MIKQDSSVTMKKFVEKLTAGGGKCPSPADGMKYGLQHGWLEAQDVVNSEQILLKKHGARILHNFLRLELREADEIDATPAYVLQDLFDCRVCAGHIIQVYVKGIMDGVDLPDGRMIFDAEKVISKEEAEEIIHRIFQKNVRIRREDRSFQSKKTWESEKVSSKEEAKEISLEQAVQLMQERGKNLLVDVRTEREYAEKHLKGALNAPLLSLIKNPFMFAENRHKMLLLYCEEGYQSKAAAQCLLEAGYENVAFFAWKMEMSNSFLFLN